MRPRNILLQACPWLTTSEASDYLRQTEGNVEKAKRVASANRRQNDIAHTTINKNDGASRNSTTHTTNKNGGGASQKDGTTKNNGDAYQNSSRQKTNKNGSGESKKDGDSKQPSSLAREPPRHSVSINNLSDRQYCCVWGVEVYEDGYRPDVARTLLANVARHANPILRDRGWRVKRLIESASTQWIGLCTANGRTDADAASTNIQLNLRVQPDKHCTQFRSFHQILAVMLHEITHTSIGLEDIHPPAFWELLDVIKGEYKTKLQAGEVDLEKDDYGCSGMFVNAFGQVQKKSVSATDLLGLNGFGNLTLMGSAGSGEGECGATKKKKRRGNWKRNKSTSTKGYTSNVPKKRPLLKAAKMIDKRTKEGKEAMAAQANFSARDLAARAALARFDPSPSSSSEAASARRKQEMDEIDISSSDDEEEDDDNNINNHKLMCGCRTCSWSKMFNLE